MSIVYHEARGRSKRLWLSSQRGYYYVCAVDRGRLALVAGPFRRHRGAVRWYHRAKLAALTADPWSHWYQWGTCRVEHGRKPGMLNAVLGITVR